MSLGMTMQAKAAQLREKLIASGIAADEVHRTIFRNIYPLPHRLWWTLRVTLNSDPFTAEWQFVEDLALARTVHDVDQAVFDYHCQRHEYRAFLMRPSRRRARSYFHRVMTSRH